MKFFLTYLILVNIISFILIFIDKQKAKNSSNRISENTLFLMSFIGGIFGTISGMLLFSHKTSKASFKLVVGIIVLIQFVSVYCFLKA